ncbi:MAG: nucleoside-diphosphate kinase [Methanolinea sp.]|nr:nucleoside-diphosphate kinase [Methanolinea sp.]
MDRTFVMVKPDGVARGLIGEVISRLEGKGLKLVAARFERLTEKKVLEQYREHIEKPFFPSLRHFIESGPCFLMVWEGRDAVRVVRRMVGATNPGDAEPGTIRGDLAMDTGRNVIHASDSPASAEREIAIHFNPGEIVTYKRADESALYE